MPESSELLDQNGFLAVYHDTPDRRLARVGATLSRRHERGRSVWEFRVPRSQRSPLELDAPGGPAGPPPQIERLLTAFVRQGELEPALKVRVARRGRRYEIRVLEGLRVLDTFSVKANKGQSVFLRLLDESEPSAAVEPVGWLRGVLARQYAEILRHDPGVRLALAPEDLHGLRAAVRRTRALLRAAQPIITDVAWLEPLRAELKWLGGVLGPRRDLDVLVERLRKQIAELQEPERSAAGSLLDSLEEERSAAQEQIAEALSSERYLGILDELEETARGPHVQTGDVSLSKLAALEFKRLRKAMKAVGDDPSGDELHRLRILDKRARYTAELAEAEAGDTARRFVSKAKAFQDVLGAHQDAIVAEARLRELMREARGSGAAFAAGRLVERERHRRSEARAALPKAWKKLERRGLRAWT